MSLIILGEGCCLLVSYNCSKKRKGCVFSNSKTRSSEEGFRSLRAASIQANTVSLEIKGLTLSIIANYGSK